MFLKAKKRFQETWSEIITLIITSLLLWKGILLLAKSEYVSTAYFDKLILSANFISFLALFISFQVTCRVYGCSEKHKSHYCRLCACENSKHFSQDCPKGRRLYYWTRLSSIRGNFRNKIRLIQKLFLN